MSFVSIFILGIVGGISPGPITALMLGETFKNGFKKGAQVPVALIFSNIVIGSFAIALLHLGKDLDNFISILTYTGAGVLITLGFQELFSKGELEFKQSAHPFQKALFIDAFNPHPYIIWFTVLGPALVQKEQHVLIGWVSFVMGLVGTKLLIVLAAHHLRPWIRPTSLKWISRILGGILLYFGLAQIL